MVSKLNVGLCACVQTSFWGSSCELFKNKYLPEMEKLSVEWGFLLTVWRENLVTLDDAKAAAAFFVAEQVDFILLQSTTFPGGEVMLPFGDLDIRIGLWAIPECTESGAIPQNSLCGINMLGSIMGQYIGASKPVKWFFGDTNSSLFRERLKTTIGALRGIKRLYGANVALVGGIAPYFLDLAFDERKAKAKLGVNINRLVEYGDMKERALAYTESEITPVIEAFLSEARSVTQSVMDTINITSRFYKAFEDLFVKDGFDAITIGCWPKYRRDFGIVICGIIGRLLENGYLAACEGDIDSALGFLLLNGVSDDMPMVMDISKVDFERDRVLFWHCGSAPGRFAGKDGVHLKNHYKPGRHVSGADEIGIGIVNDMVYSKSPISVARFTWEYEKMLVFGGHLVDEGDPSFDGSRGWAGDLTLAGESINALDLVNSLLVSRFQHHYPVVRGNWTDEVMEACAWLGISPILKIGYKNYLQNFGY